MKAEVALNLLENLVFQGKGKRLNDLERKTITGTWLNWTYEVIGTKTERSPGYIRNTVAPKLWRSIDKALENLGIEEDTVSKNNLRAIIERSESKIRNKLAEGENSSPTNSKNSLENIVKESSIAPKDLKELALPKGALAIDSPFYVNRERQEEKARSEISKQGGFLKIEGEKKIGKTSLLIRVLNYAEARQYNAIYLDLHLAEQKILYDFDELLKWICISVTRKLNLANKIEDYWDFMCGGKINCTTYFEEYLLIESDRPIVLALDKVDYLFKNMDLALDFFGLLRAWYDAKSYNKLWENLRIVVVYCENLLPLDAKQSPDNIGTSVVLQEFEAEQIKQLAKQYSIIWQENNIEKILQTVGGHPYSIHKLIYDFSRQKEPLELFLASYSK